MIAGHDEGISSLITITNKTICSTDEDQRLEHSRQKAQIDIGLDERVKAVSRSRFKILEILNDWFARCGSNLIDRLIHAEVASGLFLRRVSH